MYTPSHGIYKELQFFATVFLFASLLGWVFDAFFIAFLLGYLGYIGYHLYAFVHLLRWLNGEDNVEIPIQLGVWQVIASAFRKRFVSSQKQLVGLQEQVKKYQHLQRSLPGALVALTPDNRIEWLNETAEKLLGFRQQDLGRRIEYFLRDPGFVAYCHQRQYDEAITFYSTVNHYQLLSAQLLPYYQDCHLLLVQDITELHKMAQMRKDFVANASHELRTPLTVLSGYLEMMSDLTDDALAPWQHPIKNMQSQANRMQHIIEDLLALSAIENNASQGTKAWVNVPSILEGVHQQALQLSQGRHKIVFNVETQAGVVGFQEALVSVFTNLVSNAIRYTPEGGRVEIAWREQDGKAIFSVKDNGIGIAREDIPRLTERFFRVDTARSRDTGGTGLGLAIVKHVLDLHHAELKIESQLYVGSEFRVVFEPMMPSLVA